MANEAELRAARRLLAEVAAEAPSKPRLGRSGRHTMRVPAAAFFNAIDGNGGVQRDGRTVWDDEGFRGDMQRLHPECAVGLEGGRVFGVRRSVGHSMRNRFGRVSFRKVYAREGGGG